MLFVYVMTDRLCMWKNCKTMVKVNTSLEQSDVGKRWGIVVGKWCKKHSKLYHKQCVVFTKLLDKWNKKNLINKFGRPIKFTHHSELSNYLFQYERKEYIKIIKGVKV